MSVSASQDFIPRGREFTFRRRSNAMVLLVILPATLFSTLYVIAVIREVAAAHFSLFPLILLGFKTLVEVGASYYGFTLLFIAVHYLCKRQDDVSPPQPLSFPSVAVVYLCCDDLDLDALESVVGLRYRGKLCIAIHDDSNSKENRDELDRQVQRLRRMTSNEIVVLRRADKRGGKPGATNYVLHRLKGIAEYVLICDNDSTILDPHTIEAALSYFEDPAVAVVQCRNVAVHDPAACRVNRLLAGSIDAFHAFLLTHARFGWQPFVGHNALLRLSAVLNVGGFTPGFFSDDLDLTVRLNLVGFRVVYAPLIQIGEKHPASYEAFRRRTYKWAYGCVQSLKAHAWSVLRSNRFSLAEKFSFFQFTGFYVAQSVLLLYLIVNLLLAPWFINGYPVKITAAFFAGTLMILVTYAPVLAYFARDGLRSWIGTVLMCGLVYGSSDFAGARGVWDCLRNRSRSWTPTNSRSASDSELPLVGEALFGASLLLVPLAAHSPAVYLPAFYLFAGKFLWGPSISAIYKNDHPTARPLASRMLKIGQIAVLVLMVAILSLLFHPHMHASASKGVQVQGKSLLIDGQPFQVRGMHYGPWRPGTGPGKEYPYPSRQEIDSDLKLIKTLNVNTILVVDAPAYVLDAAQESGLKVLYSFTINWWTLSAADHAALRQDILDRVATLQTKPALLGWILGNEVPSVVLDARGQVTIQRGLRELYASIKQLDPQHPITHSNWPITKNLDLGFLDFASFNVYPLWPPEVVARGFGNYVKDVLMPIAGAKPLLISEFGANTLEAGDEGEGRLLKSSWSGLLDAGACGGVVFEFADEWWKNYDNPKREGDWWDRRPDPDDEKRHDLDPEEYYGVMTAERQPKLAAVAVKEMFSSSNVKATSALSIRVIPAALVCLLILLACGAWLWAKSRMPSEQVNSATQNR
jgi:hypothetical protein